MRAAMCGKSKAARPPLDSTTRSARRLLIEAAPTARDEHGHQAIQNEPQLRQLRRRGQAVVVIESDAEIQGRVACLDVVLDVRGLLLDRERLVVGQR